MDALYLMLRHLTSPVVAITTSARGRRNGMIANSAQRASLAPSLPRVSVYISKTNVSHDLIYHSGVSECIFCALTNGRSSGGLASRARRK